MKTVLFLSIISFFSLNASAYLELRTNDSRGATTQDIRTSLSEGKLVVTNVSRGNQAQIVISQDAAVKSGFSSVMEFMQFINAAATAPKYTKITCLVEKYDGDVAYCNVN